MTIIEPSALSKYLSQYESFYPGIGIWWEKRVVPDIETGVKTVRRYDRDYDVMGLAVFDRVQGKLCHLSLDLIVRGIGLGQAILNDIKADAAHHNHSEIWCHGREDIADMFVKWSGAHKISTVGKFGRSELEDVKMVINWEETCQDTM